MKPESQKYPESQEYKKHRIEIRPEASRDGQGIILIDGESHRYGTLPNGRFFMHDYAYDWTDDLAELARRYVDYVETAREVRATREKTTNQGR